jgi:hypothetical protein
LHHELVELFYLEGFDLANDHSMFLNHATIICLWQSLLSGFLIDGPHPLLL